MRALGMVKYHWRRQWKTALFFTLMMMVISTITVIVTCMQNTSTMLVFTDGVARLVKGAGWITLSFNYSPLFVILLWVTAISLLRYERSFFITASSSRWEFLLGAFMFIVMYAAGLSLTTYLVSVFNRLTLVVMGIQMRQPWTLGMIMTGNEAGLLGRYTLEFTGMICAAGYASLIYVLFARWWKQILILMGTGIVVLVVLGVQISLGAYTQSMVDFARGIVEWIENVYIPKIVPMFSDFFNESRTWVLALRDIVQGLVCYAIIYPVIMKMRVK